MNQQRFDWDQVSTLPDHASTLLDRESTLPASVPFSVLSSAVFLRHPRAKRYVVRVTREGIVRVTIPRRGSKREAAEFAASQRGWIAQQLARLERERAQPRDRIAPDQLRTERRRAGRELPARLLALAAQLDLRVSKVSVRNQRWRWGSCSPAGHICLNWRLVTMPDWVRDYVLIHELMHLKRMDHSPAFWKLVEAACPNWRDARAYLREQTHI